MSKLARVCAVAFLWLTALYAFPQATVISDQAIDQNGQPLPNAMVRVCSATSMAVPCTPPTPIFQDYNLTVPAPNPWTADQYGNYTLYAPALPAPNLYVVQISPDAGITWSRVYPGPPLIPKYSSGPVNSVQASDGNGGFISDPAVTLSTTYHALFAGNINGEVYPAQCGQSPAPTWCTGTTADAWIRAACTQLPTTGGTINLLGLSGTIANSVTCSTASKQVIMLTDPTSLLTVTESDGGTPFPIDSHSMFLGPGNGDCVAYSGGIYLAETAVVTGIVGPARTDGTEEDFTVSGNCLWGSPFGHATVSKGLAWTKATFSDTTISNNNLDFCENACIWLENAGGSIIVQNNEMDPTDGAYGVIGSGLVITSSGSSTGCVGSNYFVSGGDIQHANGGASYPEVNIHGNGAGAFPCAVYMHDVYMERNVSGTPSTIFIKIQDCWNCSFANIQALGGNGTPSGDTVNLSQSASGRVENVTFANIEGAAATNVINDTSTNGIVIPLAITPFVTSYYSNPGYVQPPILPPTTIQSLGADLTAGQGNFGSGSGTFGTNFSATGCVAGTTCVYTRTNSTAPPGYTYSQEIQITANGGGGINGLIYVPSVAVTAGKIYIAGVWAKSDGTYAGPPTFVLGNEAAPPIYCYDLSTVPLNATWNYYTFACTAPTSTSTFLNIGTTSNQTGTFWLAGFTFSPLAPMTVGADLVATGPYAVGAALLYNASTNPLPACNTAAKGQKFTVADATTPTYLGTYTSGGAVTAPVVCNGSAWVTY